MYEDAGKLLGRRRTIKIQALKRRLFEILEIPEEGDFVSFAFDIFILAVIALNVVGIILESLPGISDDARYYLYVFRK